MTRMSRDAEGRELVRRSLRAVRMRLEVKKVKATAKTAPGTKHAGSDGGIGHGAGV